MGVRTWHFIIGEDGIPRRLTQKAVANLRERGGTMPEHASQRRKLIIVELDAQRQAPPVLIQAYGTFWHFDEKGGLGAQLWQEQVDRGNLMPGALATSWGSDLGQDAARREFVRQEIIERTIWKPTDADMEPVIRDIWRMPLDKWRTLNLEVPEARH